jgi:hypothetical protein
MTTRDDGSLLIDGETVVWSGRPAQGLLFTSRDCSTPVQLALVRLHHLLGDYRAVATGGALIYEALRRCGL